MTLDRFFEYLWSQDRSKIVTKRAPKSKRKRNKKSRDSSGDRDFFGWGGKRGFAEPEERKMDPKKGWVACRKCPKIGVFRGSENEECNGDLPEKWPDLGPKAGSREKGGLNLTSKEVRDTQQRKWEIRSSERYAKISSIGWCWAWTGFFGKFRLMQHQHQPKISSIAKLMLPPAFKFIRDDCTS